MFYVVENTPGYLPESDDPPGFETEADARECLKEEVERYCEYLDDAGNEFTVYWDRDLSYANVSRLVDHDLGRVFEIIEDE